MKVLTIKQPWASLIVYGYKEYEFRTWNTKYRGEFLIHSSKNIDKKALKLFEKYNLDYPLGCIIGKCSITDCINVDKKFRNILKAENTKVYKNIVNDETWNGYAFKLENVEKINPIYINGKLGFWNYNSIE